MLLPKTRCDPDNGCSITTQASKVSEHLAQMAVVGRFELVLDQHLYATLVNRNDVGREIPDAALGRLKGELSQVKGLTEQV